MNFILKILISTLSVLITAYILPHVHVDSIYTAIMVAVVLAFLNAVLKPIMILLSLPITVYTLGLFLIVINTLLILLTSHLVKGFYVEGFWVAMWFSIVLSFVSSVLDGIRKRDERRRGE
jgi:putative membrane protein